MHVEEEVVVAASEALIMACKLWDKVTTKAHDGDYELPELLNHFTRNHPYSEGDYKPLKCRITGNVAELTVGSASGHKAHVDLEKKTVEYYDSDRQPNEVMRDLFEEEAGLKCKLDSDGVKCTGLKKTNVGDVFKVLAMPTSMDFRLNHCNAESRPDPEEGCREQCQEDIDANTSIPTGCDCEQWVDDCTQECVDNTEPEEEEDCLALEKQWFADGPKKEKLTKAEAMPPSQQKLMF